MSKNQYCQKMGFLGVIVESKELNVFPPQGKVSEIIEQCQLFLARDQVSMTEFSIGWEAVLFINSCSSSSLDYRSSQRQ